MRKEAEPIFFLRGRTIFVAGHGGLVGSALTRRLADEDCTVLTATRAVMDLRRQGEVEDWFAEHRPEAVFLAAATVGGIRANETQPAEFLYDNMMIEANLIEAARRVGVRKLLFLGSSCIYPKHAPQPIREESLLTGPLEPTNEFYAIAKMAGLKLVQSYRRQFGCDFVSVMPTSLYGPGDTYDLQASHVIPALILKAHAAKQAGAESFQVWGTGTPKREFLYADDLADACVFVMQHYSSEMHLNVGSGREVTIRDLAKMIAEVVGFRGRIVYDPDMSDGTPRKLLDSRRLTALGWRATTGLRDGLELTYKAHLAADRVPA